MILRRIFGENSNKQSRCEVAERFTSPVGAREWPEICSRGSRRKPSITHRGLLLVSFALFVKRLSDRVVFLGRTFRDTPSAPAHVGIPVEPYPSLASSLAT